MADNVAITAGSGTTIAADDISGVLHQRVKISQGADGSATDVSSAAPLNVTLANTGANTNKLLVTPDLPSGASTSAKQDTIIGHLDGVETSLGTLATEATLAGAIKAEDAAHSSGDKGVQALTVRQNTAASLSGTDGDYQPLITDTNGKLWVNTGLTQPTTPSDTQPISHASLTELAAAINSDKVDVNIASGNISGFATSAKQDTAQTALDAIKTATETLDNAISGSEMQVDVVGALPAGNNNIGDVDVASIAAGTNTIGKVNTLPETTGGLSIFRSIDLDESEEEVKGTAGQIYTLWFSNMATSTRFLKIYNATAANVTVGTTTPIMTLALPGNSSDDISGVFASTHGLAFDTAITVAATTGIADNDTGAPAANDVIVNIGYK